MNCPSKLIKPSEMKEMSRKEWADKKKQMEDYLRAEEEYHKSATAFLNRLEDLNLSPEFQDEFLWLISNGRYND